MGKSSLSFLGYTWPLFILFFLTVDQNRGCDDFVHHRLQEEGVKALHRDFHKLYSQLIDSVVPCENGNTTPKASWICILFQPFHFIGNVSKKERAK